MSERFDIIVYTFGTRSYAVEILKLLDPEEKYLDRKKLITRNESLKQHKEFDKVLSRECLDWVVILDDTKGVWGECPGNLLHVKSFDFFKDGGHGGKLEEKSQSKQKGVFYERRDESMGDIYLMYIRIFLKLLHEMFFRHNGEISVQVKFFFPVALQFYLDLKILFLLEPSSLILILSEDGRASRIIIIIFFK